MSSGFGPLINRGGYDMVDKTTDGKVPKKKGGKYEDSNISQDPTGEMRSSTLIVAEAGIDAPPATYISGDGMDIESSGPQQINRSRVTGIRYQTPYQVIDKTGTGNTFEVVVEAETNEVRQAVFDTQLTSPNTVTETAPTNHIVNKFYVRTDGTVENFRFQMVSVATGNVILSYPDKFKYEKDEGVTLTGAGMHELDLYYVDNSAPTRVLSGEQFTFTRIWTDAGGTLLGNSADEPYFAEDIQEFEFVNIITQDDSVTELADVTDAGSGAIITTAERSKLSGLTGGRYLGVFADLTALQTAHPTAVSGDTATVTSPDGNLFYWNVSAWADSGTGYIGDMLKAVYDPTPVNGDAFAMANMVEGATEKILTATERTKLAGIEDGADKSDLGEVKMIALSLAGAVTKGFMQGRGWAVCDGTTPVSQGITSATITTTPDLQDKFIRMSNDETSGTTGGVDQNSITWASRSVDDNGATVVGTVEGTTSGTKNFDNKPPFYELVFFIKVK